jgi:AbrB family looped-hinge helix DNA binding protein
MSIVTLSPKFQVVIPQRIRQTLGLKAGQKIEAIQYLDRVEFIPVKSPRAMRGFLKGINTTVLRDKDRP